MTKRARIAIGVAVVFVALGYLVFTGISRSATYYVTVSELRAKGAAMVDRPVRVTGKLDGSSVKWDSSQILLTFDLSDGQNRMTATYHGVKPDGMDDGRDIVVEGKLDQKGAFEVKNILVKCPSKYESKPATGG
ncbi:MAG TPA: cytochrome c maturation protein CcmE [Bacillota bacterium]|jgi:cytochrome c-type biogenesis protein CcmE